MDDKIIELCNRAISANLSEREKPTIKEVSRIKEDMNLHGVLYSSMTLKRIQEYLENELDVESIIIWQTIVKILSIMGIREINQDILKKMYDGYFKARYLILDALLMKESPVVGPMNIPSLLEKKTQIQKKMEVEIELYVENVKKAGADAQAVIPLNSVVIYGNVGAVQTGLNSSANVIQNISEERKDEICRLLSQVRDSISTLKESISVSNDELIEIVNNCIDEMKGHKPNSTRIKSLLTGVAMTIQTTASLAPAYQALKTVLVYFGICLP